MSGCLNCDEKQLETGDKGAMCPACEIGLCEQNIITQTNRIEELKKLLQTKEE